MDRPHSIIPQILDLIQEISRSLGKVNVSGLLKIAPELRKENKIRTIHSTLAIEGNNLTKDQITKIIDKKAVRGPKKDILEVQNAIEVYNHLNTLNPYSEASFKKAHKLLMKGILKADGGQYRTQAVGVGDHMAPSHKLVPGHMKSLFASLKKSREPLLIRSCVFHYEQEFIHPFIDGNGRMGRLWQSLLLCRLDPVFEYIPIENFVKDSQNKYYAVLRKCDLAGDSTLFIEFMLGLINKGLTEFLSNKSKPLSSADRLEIARNHFGKSPFSRKEYVALFTTLSLPTGTRDLRFGVNNKILKRSGNNRNSIYRFI